MSNLGSFPRVADRLNTTQPNISARISTLESALGSPAIDLAFHNAAFSWLTTGNKNPGVFPLKWVASKKSRYI